MKLSVILPCYNEEENVAKMKQELLPVLEDLNRQYEMEVIFVDDGSRDQTLTALQSTFGSLSYPTMQFCFLKHEVNRGLGAAMRTGFSGVHGDLVVTTDSDGTYKFSSIPQLLARLVPGVDIVTASPYHPEGGVAGVPKYRLVLSQGASFLYRVLVSWKIHTYTCLFRAYRREVIDTITFQSDGFLAGTELMVKAMLKGYMVAEYPAVLYSRMFGTSKAKIARTIRAHLAFQGRILLHRLHIARLV
jgi:dolichol-phosphate mannosyltransferase